MFYTYIIYSKSKDIYYKGFSESPTQRLLDHNENKSRYTSGKGPWEFVYLQSFQTKKEALVREKKLKKYSKEQISKLIASELNELN